jgi:hypothetical protein
MTTPLPRIPPNPIKLTQDSAVMGNEDKGSGSMLQKQPNKLIRYCGEK